MPLASVPDSDGVGSGGDPAFPLVGRQAELAALVVRLGEQRRSALVAGVAGVGETRLIDDQVSRVGPRSPRLRAAGPGPDLPRLAPSALAGDEPPARRH